MAGRVVSGREIEVLYTTCKYTLAAERRSSWWRSLLVALLRSSAFLTGHHLPISRHETEHFVSSLTLPCDVGCVQHSLPG